METQSIEEVRECYRCEGLRHYKIKIVHCERCGAEIQAITAAKKYCPSCKKEVVREQDRERRRREHERHEKCGRPSKPEKRKSTIAEMVAAAKAAGLSYGQYKARLSTKGE